MSNLKYRFLTPDDLPQMYRSFIEAFSQYSVNMSMSKAAFSRRMKDKLNINYNLSPAAFDGEKLIGFIFHATAEYQGKKTAYNGGTGVIPGYWGKGITQKLLEYNIPNLKIAGVERCLLEVITTNTQAIRAYTKSGFIKTKVYKCIKLTSPISKSILKSEIVISTSKSPNLKSYELMSSTSASMLDDFNQLIHNLENELTLEAHLENQLVGYLIFQPQLGRISQMAVHPTFRRLKIGTALLFSAQSKAVVKSLSVINIDDKQLEILQFLEKLGFENQLDQLEMELTL